MMEKPIAESRTVMTDLVLPPATNNYGTIFGGNVMSYVDRIASIAAMRHARQPVVTASSDSLDFLVPIKSGEAIRLEAYVTWTHNTSMEVYVRIESEDLLTGAVRLTGTSYLTFVALDMEGHPSPVPRVVPTTEEEKWHHRTAPLRYEARKRRKAEGLAAFGGDKQN